MQIYRIVNICQQLNGGNESFHGTIRDYFLLAAAGLAIPGAVTG
jgi:hypothetical protein